MPSPVFKTGSFDHSDTPPERLKHKKLLKGSVKYFAGYGKRDVAEINKRKLLENEAKTKSNQRNQQDKDKRKTENIIRL